MRFRPPVPRSPTRPDDLRAPGGFFPPSPPGDAADDDGMGAAREHLARVEALFHQALTRPAPERAAWVRGGSGDPHLVAEVLALLAADDASRADAPRWLAAGSLADLMTDASDTGDTGEDAPGGDAPDGDAPGAPDGTPDDTSHGPPAPRLAPGDRVGIYRVVRLLGRGGMGAVHLAEREDVGARVALKVVRGSRARDVRVEARFLAERRALARLAHPSVARLLDAGIVQGGAADGAPWFAMEYVDGEPVDVACDRRRLGVRARLALFAEVCGAVEAAHQQLVIHRDLKPSNVLVTAEGRPMLLDFGIAATLDGGATPPIQPPHESPDTWQEAGRDAGLASAHGLLTPQYAAPEQVRGDPPSVSVDVYALGLLLFELLTGRRPYEVRGRTRAAIARAVLAARVPRPSDVVAVGDDAAARAAARATRPAALRRTLLGDLDAIVLRALARDPAERYAGVGALCADVRRVLAYEPVSARAAAGASGLLYRTGRLLRRRRAAVTTGVLVAGAAAVVAANVLNTARLTAEDRDRARAAAVRAARVRDVLVGLFDAANPDHPAGAATDRSPEALLRRGEAVADALAGEPGAQADLLVAIGRAWNSLGDLPAATRVFERAVAIRRAHLAPNDPATADALDQLASVLNMADRLPAADSVIRLSLEIRQHDAASAAVRAGVGTGPPRLAAMLGLASSPWAGRETPGDSTAALALARTLVRDGQIKFGAGQCAAALPMFRQAAAVFARWPGGAVSAGVDEPATATAADRDTGGVPRVPAVSRGAVLWPAEAASDLARCLDHEGTLGAAEPMHLAALALHERFPSDYRLQYTAALNNYGLHLTAVGRFAEAEAVLRRALAIKRATLPPRHYSIGASLNSLGAFLSTAGRAAEAESAYTDALAITREALGDAHRRVPVAFLGVGIVRWQRGNAAGAAAAFGDGLRLARAGRPLRPNMVRRTAAGLGTALLALGRTAEAEALLREAVTIERARGDVPRPSTFTAATPGAYEAEQFSGPVLRARWATALARLGRAADAERVRRGELPTPVGRARAG